jgi:TetR/AcrR family transcriptional repressor of nem operon
MPRPREYDRLAVIEAAKETFWLHGYEATGLDLLENVTHLSRSSMYLAFGSKRALFDAAMDQYRNTFITSVLGRVEAPSADAEDAAAYFVTLASLFRGELGSRGCLMVNAIGELGGRDPDMSRQGAEFHGRFREAFANALRSTVGRGPAQRVVLVQRSETLAVAAMGVWITSRVDPAGAAEACEAIVQQIRLWRESVSNRPRSRRSPRR